MKGGEWRSPGPKGSLTRDVDGLHDSVWNFCPYVRLAWNITHQVCQSKRHGELDGCGDRTGYPPSPYQTLYDTVPPFVSASMTVMLNESARISNTWSAWISRTENRMLMVSGWQVLCDYR